jgi:hypothetical protein
MKTFEIFWNNGRADGEDFKITKVAEDIDCLLQLMQSYNCNDYHAFDDNEYCFVGPYRDLDELFGIEDDEDAIAYINRTLEDGWIGFREVSED